MAEAWTVCARRGAAAPGTAEVKLPGAPEHLPVSKQAWAADIHRAWDTLGPHFGKQGLEHNLVREGTLPGQQGPP